jgi:hypothetical protein
MNIIINIILISIIIVITYQIITLSLTEKFTTSNDIKTTKISLNKNDFEKEITAEQKELERYNEIMNKPAVSFRYTLNYDLTNVY